MLYRQSEIVFDVVFVSDGVYSLEHLFLYIVDKGLKCEFGASFVLCGCLQLLTHVSLA